MFWNVDIQLDYDGTMAFEEFSVYASDISDARDKGMDALTDSDIGVRERNIVKVDIVEVKNIKNLHEIGCIRDALDEAISMGIPDDFVRVMHKLTGGEY